MSRDILADALEWGSREFRFGANERRQRLFEVTPGFDAEWWEDPWTGKTKVACAKCHQEVVITGEMKGEDMRIDHECPDVVNREMGLRAGRRERIARDGDGKE